MAKQVGYLTVEQEKICELDLAGKSYQEIIKAVYGVEKDDPHYRKYSSRIQRLKESPKFAKRRETLLNEIHRKGYGKALNKMISMVDDPNPWVSLQASNNVLNYAGKIVLPQEQNTVTVKIEGMPTLGAPDPDALPEAQDFVAESNIIEAVESSVT